MSNERANFDQQNNSIDYLGLHEGLGLGCHKSFLYTVGKIMSPVTMCVFVPQLSTNIDSIVY